MNNFTTSSPLACDHSYAADFLAQYDEYINGLVQKKVQRSGPYWWMSDLDADELAQRVRIKLWHILRKHAITNPHAYIKCVVDTAAVDMTRYYKHVLPLMKDEEGELYQGNLLIMPGKGMQDPADELVQKEEGAEVIKKYIAAILTLPPCQRYVVICTLKENFDDIRMLISVFQDFGIDIEPMHRSTKREDVQRLRASLSISRKKLRPLFKKFSWEDAC